ncbi:cytochrome P450 2U1-like [Clavelina lepadiformis]|uniref:cytochrome P450 2U1-like n=1 Tax=Clavelina lepadiformis TaxID=159417 RepID=UPI0040415981
MLNYILSCPNILLTTVIAVLLLFMWYRRKQYLPPGPRGVPFFGVLPFLGKWPERALQKWSKFYGPIMTVRMGGEDYVVLNDYESVNQAFVKQHTKFSGRPPIPVIEQITEGHGIVFLDYGPLWRSQRKFGLLTLRGFGAGRRSMESRILEEVSYLNDEIRSKDGKAFDISEILHQAVSNNICSIVMGNRFEYDDKTFAELLHALKTFDDKTYAFTLQLLMLAPKLIFLPPFYFINRMFMKSVRRTLKMLRKVVDEHKQTFDKNQLRDFIDAFLKETEESKNEDFSDVQLFQYVRDLFVAGTETTSSTLYWGLLCMLHYPETQKKLRKEIFEVVGSSGSASNDQKAEMPYMNAFIQELMRFRTLLPLNLLHKTNEDAKLNEMFIPKDTKVICNLWAIHNDPEYWNEPEKFKPERFIDENGEFVKSYHVIPFSVGPRHCLGEQLARMELFIFLVSMLQKFEFLPDPDASELPTINDGANGAVFVAKSYQLVAREI